MTQAQLKRIKAKRRREAELKRRKELKDAEFNFKCLVGFVTGIAAAVAFLMQWGNIFNVPLYVFAGSSLIFTGTMIGTVALLEGMGGNKW